MVEVRAHGGVALQKISKLIRQFLTAEEVPRWFGLSMVLIYIVGLGAVSQIGIQQARRESNEYFDHSANYAVKLLAERLTALEGTGPGDPLWIGSCQRELRDFSSNIPVRSARIVAGSRTVASGRTKNPHASTESGTSTSGNNTDEGTRLDSDRVIRFPLNLRGLAHADSASSNVDTGKAPQADWPHLEVVVPATLPSSDRVAAEAGKFVILLVVLGAFFVVYRCLREQLRGVARIAHRLNSHRDRLQEELSSLRIADTLDGVTTSWNDLVDLTQRLLDSVRRTEANEELSKVLQRTGSGALADALNAIPDGILFISEEVRFEFVNAAALRLFQWTPQDVKQFTVIDAKSQGVGTKLLELVRACRQPDGTYEARCEIVEAKEPTSADASSYRVWILPLQHGRCNGDCVVMIRDASQQIRSDRAREEFIAQVTHELRTPLTNIRAYAETLSSGMFDDPKVITECYNVITKETRRLSRLVEDILSVSQLEVGSIDLRIDQVDLRTLLTDGVRDVRGIADEKKIDLQIALPSKLEPIRGDRDKLAVVVNNLLGNAIKYTPGGGNVVVGCQVTAESVVLTVKDNGIGISPADQARVFEKFQRGTGPEVQKESGTGIGLYTAREIVRRHGGDIELISELQKGSTFMVRLPLKESRANALHAAPEGAVHG